MRSPSITWTRTAWRPGTEKPDSKPAPASAARPVQRVNRIADVLTAFVKVCLAGHPLAIHLLRIATIHEKEIVHVALFAHVSCPSLEPSHNQPVLHVAICFGILASHGHVSRKPEGSAGARRALRSYSPSRCGQNAGDGRGKVIGLPYRFGRRRWPHRSGCGT